jgi:hypothetical protein
MASKKEDVRKEAQRIKRIIRSVMTRLEIEGYFKQIQSTQPEESSVKTPLRKRGL